jgi:uncharacterized protein with FMN-binding domain
MFPKRGAIALVTTALALILLFNFKTPEQAVAGTVASVGGSSASAGPASASPGAGSTSGTAAAPTSPSTTGSASAAQTVTGSIISTRYGNVEVQLTVAGGKITAVQAVALPSGGRSGQISSSAAPVLASEALTAQSANIDIVSGATYTSQAYAQSLQAALDQAGIATTPVSG